MKNVIVILGSPRRGGNSETLAKEFSVYEIGAIKGTKYLDQAYRLGLKVK